MFLLICGEFVAFNANQVEKLYIREPSSTGSDYYEIVARMVSGREYVIFKGIDLVETLMKFYQTIKEGKNGLQQGNPDRPSDERPGD